MRPSGAESARDSRRSASSTPPLAPQHRSLVLQAMRWKNRGTSALAQERHAGKCLDVPRRHTSCERVLSWSRNTHAVVKPHTVWLLYPHSYAAYPEEFSPACWKVMRHESRRCWPTLEEHWHNRRRDLNSALPSGVSRRMPAQKLSGSSRNSPPCSCLPPQREVEPSILAYTYCMSRRNLRGGMHLRVR